MTRLCFTSLSQWLVSHATSNQTFLSIQNSPTCIFMWRCTAIIGWFAFFQEAVRSFVQTASHSRFQTSKIYISCSCLVFLLRRGPSIVKCLRKGLWTVQRLSQRHCSSLRCFCEAFSLYHFLRNTSFMDCSVWCSCSTLSLKLNILHWIMIIIASLSSSISCWQYLSGNVDCTVPTYWFIFGPFTNLPFGIDKPSILTSKP